MKLEWSNWFYSKRIVQSILLYREILVILDMLKIHSYFITKKMFDLIFYYKTKLMFLQDRIVYLNLDQICWRSTERQYCKDGKTKGESTWPAILNCHGIHGENWAVCTLKCPYLNWFSWPLFKELILGVPEVKETWMHFWYEFAGKAFYSRTRFHWFCAF